MFEEFRALENTKKYFHGYEIIINPSRCTATVKISNVEIWLDPTNFPGDWCAVDLKRGDISTVYESRLSRDERKEILNISKKLEEYYKIELDKLPCPMGANISFLWG